MTRKHRTPSLVRLGSCVVSVSVGVSTCWGACSVYDESLLTEGTGKPDSSAGTDGVGGSSGTDGAGGDSGGVAGTSGTGAVGGASGTAGTDGGSCPPTAGPWWGQVNSYGCQTTGRPKPDEKPPASCEGPSIAPILLAVNRLRLANVKNDATLTRDPEAWRDIGFDLDNSCTRSPTCSVPPDGGDVGDAASPDAGDADDGGPRGPLVDEPACKNESGIEQLEGNQCRDNMLGYIFQFAGDSPELGTKLGVNEGSWNCALWRGEFSIIIRVSEYNGTPDDPQVRVDIYTSPGLKVPPGWSCLDNGVLRNDWQGFAPWPPTGKWKIARRSLATTDPGNGVDLPRARHADPIAYVRGGYLVSQLPAGTELWLDGKEAHAHVAGYRAVIHRAVTVAKLAKGEDGLWTFKDGVISGVAYPPDIVEALEEIGFCKNFCDSYNILIQFLNSAQDALVSSDMRLPDSACDGISMGLSFTSKEVKADPADIVDSDPMRCPNPKDPTLPRQGCVCLPTGGCVPPDGGADGG